MRRRDLESRRERGAARAWASLGAGAIFALVAMAAVADEGVIEINAACAVQTGCLPGDAPGYPVTIPSGTGPTRFALTSDLVVPFGSSTDAVSVSRRNVTLDLRGFRIITDVCVAAPGPGCFFGGFSIGISSPSGDGGLTVRNGAIVGFGGDGVNAGDRLTLSRVDLRWNGGDGVEADDQARLDSVRAIGNEGAGVLLGAESSVRNSFVIDSNEQGIQVGADSVVEGNTVIQSRFTGIRAFGAVVRANVATGNGDAPDSSTGDGIRLSGGNATANLVVESADNGIEASQAVMSHNVASGNARDGLSGTFGHAEGNVARSNGGDGILCGAGRASTNAIRENAGNGLVASTRCSYANNTVTGSGGLNVGGGGFDSGGNSCDGAACP